MLLWNHSIHRIVSRTNRWARRPASGARLRAQQVRTVLKDLSVGARRRVAVVAAVADSSESFRSGELVTASSSAGAPPSHTAYACRTTSPKLVDSTRGRNWERRRFQTCCRIRRAARAAGRPCHACWACFIHASSSWKMCRMDRQRMQSSNFRPRSSRDNACWVFLSVYCLDEALTSGPVRC